MGHLERSSYSSTVVLRDLLFLGAWSAPQRSTSGQQAMRLTLSLLLSLFLGASNAARQLRLDEWNDAASICKLYGPGRFCHPDRSSQWFLCPRNGPGSLIRCDEGEKAAGHQIRPNWLASQSHMFCTFTFAALHYVILVGGQPVA